MMHTFLCLAYLLNIMFVGVGHVVAFGCGLHFRCSIIFHFVNGPQFIHSVDATFAQFLAFG